LNKRILVYGTLRRKPYGNAPLMRGANFVGEVTIPGYDMYNLGAFPGIKPNPSNAVGIVTEMYEIPDDIADDLIKHLDYYEGYREGDEASLYLREEIKINDIPADIYVYNRTTDEKWVEHIPSGNWRDAQ
jgi:gamma-glutamylcyclotransferase (GGCT)/AIG2-like uncharacterized protein YtfP